MVKKMTHEFVVGKYTLESLTNGMYSSPFDLYREYIQNAVDSIDEAVSSGLISKSDARIDIVVDTTMHSIKIRDNGCGINSNDAVRTLVDIGNSKKSRLISRGFRGIGRLAGLGYCESLSFVTSAINETQKTTITFDANRLKQMLIPGQNDDDSIYDVIDAVVSKSVSSEKANCHYFEVILNGVSPQNGLIEYEPLKKYLVQNAPLPFAPDFMWGGTIKSKLAMSGFSVPEYNLHLFYNSNSEQLFKPYADVIISDRVKKIDDSIHDIQIKVLGTQSEPLAIMWYASTNFFGTIIDTSIKGLRMRQGNLLIGDHMTCSQFFKEERFNGWVIGEIHIINNGLIANSRRDNFEQNEFYFRLIEDIKDCASIITKELRALSYSRSLTSEKRAIVEAESIDDVNGLMVEDMDFTCDADEYTLMNTGEGDLESQNDFLDKLSLLLGQKSRQTKYTAININDKLTMEQRRVLERVFDLICQEYTEDESKAFINLIAKKF